MLRRRIALMSIDPWPAGHEHFRPFNYSIRRIQAALIASGVDPADVTVFDLRTDDVDAIVAEVEALDPDLVGASAYVWSFPTFVTVAERLKRNRPDRCIVFGGPSARPAMFAHDVFRHGHRFVDVLVLGDGEAAIGEIAALPTLDRASLSALRGLAVSTDDGFFETPTRPRIEHLDQLASPARMGLVPHGATAHLETFRGCPFSCAYCEWGVLGTSSPVFSREYLVEELRAFHAAGAVGHFLVDAGLNLNARAFRNLQAAEAETGLLRDSMFNCEFYPSHASPEHLEFLAHLRFAEIGLGVQSYDPAVLKRLQRPFDPSRLAPVIDALCDVSNVTIEIILGLPGDNPKSFRETFERARRHDCAVMVYHCLVLPDGLMTRGAPDFALDYDPITLRMRSCLGWTSEDLDREWTYLCDLAAKSGGTEVHGLFCRVPAPGTRGQGHGPQRRLIRSGQGDQLKLVVPKDASRMNGAGLVQLGKK